MTTLFIIIFCVIDIIALVILVKYCLNFQKKAKLEFESKVNYFHQLDALLKKYELRKEQLVTCTSELYDEKNKYNRLLRKLKKRKRKLSSMTDKQLVEFMRDQLAKWNK